MSTNYNIVLRRLVGCEVYALAALSGAIEASVLPSAALVYGVSIGFHAALTGWCVVDARLRGRPLLHIVQVMMFFTALASAPLYLIWSRRLRGLGLALANTVVLFAVYLLSWILRAMVAG